MPDSLQRLVKYLPPLFLGLLWLSLALIFFLVLHYKSVVTSLASQGDITISASGVASQNGQVVGYADRKGDVDSFRFQLGDNSFPQALTVILPESVSGSLPVAFQSIQGTTGMAAATYGNSVSLMVPPILADSYTTATIELPTSQLKLSPAIILASWARNSSYIVGLALAVLYILITLAIMSLVTNRVVRKVTEPDEASLAGLGPESMAVLMHGSLKSSDMDVLIFYLAEQGYIEIIERGGDILLLRSSKAYDGLPTHQQILLNAMAEPGKPNHGRELIKKLHQSIYSPETSNIYLSLYSDLAEKGLFEEPPHVTHLRYKMLAIIIQLAAFIQLIVACLAIHPTIYWIIIASAVQYLVGVFLYRWAGQVTILSPRGRVALSNTEAFLGELGESSGQVLQRNKINLFYDYLAYAILAGNARQWRQHFVRGVLPIPSWFSRPENPTIDSEQFADAVLAVSDRLSKEFVDAKDPNVD